MFELIYTSAERGLMPGSRGFCTVAATRGTPEPLIRSLEALSAYRPIFPAGSPQASRNPVAFNHVVISILGRRYHVLSRIADAGLDYSGRTNKIAHHIVLAPNELPPGGPHVVFRTPGFFVDSWPKAPQWLPPRRCPAGEVPPPARCERWEATVGDAGWAGAVADTILKQPGRPVFVYFEHAQQVFELLGEAINLIPPDQRWKATFSTYCCLPEATPCQVRCLPQASPDARAARKNRTALHVDLTRRLPPAPPSPSAELARTGRPHSPAQEPVEGVAALLAEETPLTLPHPVSPVSAPSPALPARRPRATADSEPGRQSTLAARHWLALGLLGILVLTFVAGAAIVALRYRDQIQTAQSGAGQNATARATSQSGSPTSADTASGKPSGRATPQTGTGASAGEAGSSPTGAPAGPVPTEPAEPPTPGEPPPPADPKEQPKSPKPGLEHEKTPAEKPDRRASEQQSPQPSRRYYFVQLRGSNFTTEKTIPVPKTPDFDLTKQPIGLYVLVAETSQPEFQVQPEKPEKKQSQQITLKIGSLSELLKIERTQDGVTVSFPDTLKETLEIAALLIRLNGSEHCVILRERPGVSRAEWQDNVPLPVLKLEMESQDSAGLPLKKDSNLTVKLTVKLTVDGEPEEEEFEANLKRPADKLIEIADLRPSDSGDGTLGKAIAAKKTIEEPATALRPKEQKEGGSRKVIECSDCEQVQGECQKQLDARERLNKCRIERIRVYGKAKRYWPKARHDGGSHNGNTGQRQDHTASAGGLPEELDMLLFEWEAERTPEQN